MRICVLIFLACLPSLAYGELSAPIRLIEDDIPYAAPTLADMDGDGLKELLVGRYPDDPFTRSRFHVFRNLGSGEEPHYKTSAWLQADGRAASVDEFCHTGSGPQVVDFDADGIVDVVSGSRDCQLNVFLGTGSGQFALPKVFKYVPKSDDLHRRLRYNSRVFLHDWDVDGDLDVLATVRKAIWLIPNMGTNESVLFGQPTQVLESADRDKAFSSCVVADWNGDAVQDFVIGRWDGSVSWHRGKVSNSRIKAGTAPEFDAPIELVAKSTSSHFSIATGERFVSPEQPSGHVRVSVVDFNEDGLLDLLVGDAYRVTETRDRETITDQNATKERSLERQRDLERLLAIFEDVPRNETPQAKLARVAKLNAVRNECGLLWRTRHQSNHSRHGSVWVYLQQAD